MSKTAKETETERNKRIRETENSRRLKSKVIPNKKKQWVDDDFQRFS